MVTARMTERYEQKFKLSSSDCQKTKTKFQSFLPPEYNKKLPCSNILSLRKYFIFSAFVYQVHNSPGI